MTARQSVHVGVASPSKPELTVGQMAKLAKVPTRELTVQGTESDQEKKKKKEEAAKQTGGQAKQPEGEEKKPHMPSWVFDNDFDGLPPLNAAEELNRMEKELMATLAEIERLLNRAGPPKRTGSISVDPTPPDMTQFLEKLVQGEAPKPAGKDET